MSSYLASVGGKLLRIGNSLVNACCCAVRYDCVVTGTNACGGESYKCIKTPGGPYDNPNCDGMCPDDPPPRCDPPCGPCETCENCECVSNCSECETCVEGSCVDKCGECGLCVEGECYPCPDGYVCNAGVCEPPPPPPPPPPNSYYCCYEYFEEPSPGSPGESPVVRRSTSCQIGPCGEVVGGVFTPQPWRTAGGPYIDGAECADACRPHSCDQLPCCGKACNPNEEGAHDTKDQCQDNCEDDPSSGPCEISPADFRTTGSGANTWNFYFTIDPAQNRPVCVSYVSKCGHPIRVQILSPVLSDDGCTQIADRVVKVDSEWRGRRECSCEDLPLSQAFKGDPKGTVKWRTKQACVTTFEVQVMTLCSETQWEIAVSCGECPEVPDWDCCCGCSLPHPELGCMPYPFGITGDVATAMLAIEWCGVVAPDPEGSFTVLKVTGDGQTSFSMTSIQPSGGISQGIFTCGYVPQVDEICLWGYFWTGHTEWSIDDLSGCSVWGAWRWVYPLSRFAEGNSNADVFFEAPEQEGCDPCSNENLPVVTITLPE